MPRQKKKEEKKAPQAHQVQPVDEARDVKVSNVYFAKTQAGRGYWKFYFEDGKMAFLFDSRLAQLLGLGEERLSFRPPREIKIQVKRGKFGDIITKAAGNLSKSKQVVETNDIDKREEIIRMNVLRSAIEAIPLFPGHSLSELIEIFTSYIKSGEIPKLG